MTRTLLTFVITRGDSSRTVHIERDVIKVGRDPNSHLQIDDDGAARMHAVIEAANCDDVQIIDLGNQGGTRVNGTLVNKRALVEGDRIQIGNVEIEFVSAQPVSAEAQPAVQRTTPAEAQPAFVPATNPFTSFDNSNAFNPFSAGAALTPTGDESDGYVMVRSAPAVPAEEVERSDADEIEVMVLWGDNMLHVAHVDADGAFTIGEAANADYVIPSSELGVNSLDLVSNAGGTPHLHIPSGAQGWVELEGVRMTTDDARLQSAVPLTAGAKAHLEVCGFTFRVALVAAGKRVPKGLAAGFEKRSPAFFGLSALAHAAIVASMALFVPPLGLTDDEGTDKDRLYAMQAYLASQAEREQEAKEEQAAAEDANGSTGDEGQRAKDEEGEMGKLNAAKTNRRFQLKGPKSNPDPHMSRPELVQQAREFGLIGLLANGIASDPNNPTATFGRDTALGQDDIAAMGNMFGEDIGESGGVGGLGLTGIGEGGGGRWEGIGLGDIGTIGHGSGSCAPGATNCQGFGNSHGRLTGAHKTKAPNVRVGTSTVSGRLPASTIQRVVRQSYGRFRMCYEQALRNNPNLTGRVTVRFVIGNDGAVSNASNGGSDLPDSGAVGCVVRSFYGLSFPSPESGIVTVVYPIQFSPG